MFSRTAKYFSFKKSIIKYMVTNSILNVSPQTSPFIRSFSKTIPCCRIKIPITNINPEIKVPDDPYLLSKLIKKLGEQDKLEDAISIALNTKKSAQSEVVWNHLIDECVKRGRITLGIRLLNQMKKHSFVPNQQTYTILLNGIAENQTFEDNITQAKHLLEDLQQISTRHNQVKINVIHVNCFLKVCSRSNNFEALIENYNELINKGDWKPNQETYTIILNSCARHDSGYYVALKLWDQLNINPKNSKDKQKEIDQELEWGLAKRFDNIIIDDNLVRSMLLVCKNHHDYQKGLEIIKYVYGLESDVNVSKSPSFICNLSPQTLDVILDICVKKHYEKGIKLFDDALSQFPDLSLDIYIFNKLINLCNKAGECDKAISLKETIQERGLRLNIQTYDLLITSCKINEDWTTAKNLYIKMLHNNTKVFDPRILNAMFELAEIQRVKNNSSTEVKWLLNLSHEITLQNFNTQMENEKKKIYHYKKLLKKIKKAYTSLLKNKRSGLTVEEIKRYTNNLREIKIKIAEAKKRSKT
ncbi:hypothetical protein RhiirA1_536788 [Rhizophagus irregularis]|uniref:Uncharacterized protein n=6 Tax=Rhizophagus irregularis TaxID=588596 RepID=A0A2N0RNE2_9GLOM|nr:hypothetical protein GLOIN_2v643130 [Rhizophagus irregularis DAOM 181602=DAOM 197198]EXX76503.1 hypothetical protein RirG_032670 [Rhizophagus irregularis DAOM 197198w]PKC64810.1 hypothetical protein RhiirA1_536788 [Rhizophagus irregularis]POG62177.1 hypothetical protein GLOIN_2v643130 [Rhizophagus irregularis DAOM 181602=DAOM 197198]UZO08687.1 hypothetical protein OCT59_028940 [Rhizophagus irregularis]CAB5100397.1 unnamed protein product [Rhizophagus irregularis]|eukprot:XP_025169043.1 hypothetical protein GLOIN_2v643130 [Rhizophagus irregularis DAOM 181602=DAOM 197198]